MLFLATMLAVLAFLIVAELLSRLFRKRPLVHHKMQCGIRLDDGQRCSREWWHDGDHEA